jgi:hypothetical protein
LFSPIAGSRGSEDVQLRTDAPSRGDVATVLALFTDDAVVDAQRGFSADKLYVGKQAIRKDLEWLAVDKMPPSDAACGVGQERGRRTVKRLPFPSRDSAVTCPPWAAATPLTIARPRPVPPRSRWAWR